MPLRIPAEVVGLERSIQQQAQKAGRNLKINLGTSARSVEALSQPLGRITGKADEFTKSMQAANARVLAFGASVAVINGVTQGFKALVTTTIEVEKSLANINSILKQNTANLDRFKKEIFEVARNTEQTFQATAEAALELSRQGLSATEVTKRLNDSLVLARLSGLNAADSVAGLTAAINAFNSTGISSAEVLNKISAAAASAAVSDRDLIEALKRSGSVAVTTGVAFDDLVGIVAALQEKTARGGSVIGNSLKTIFTRITTLDKLKTLENLGVQTTDLGGEVLAANKIIENLAVTFKQLSRVEQVNLADKLVGKFQIAPFLALLQDYNGEVVRSAQVAETSFNATNEAYVRNAALNQTLAAAVNSATLNVKELANALGEIGVTDSLRNILGFFNGLITRIKDILEGEGVGGDFARGIVKGLSKIISGPGLAIFGAIIAKLTVDLAKFGVGSLKTFFGLNKAAQAQAQLQGQITSTLLNNSSIQKKILDIENMSLSVEQKRALQTKFFTEALNTQLGVMRQMQGIAATIAPAVMRGTGGGAGRTKSAAGGFLPVGAERSDIARGVGGAPSSARPVVIPNFAFGGGRVGPMVANTSEYVVPNYARGGDAIFNQNMASSMGLPPNAKKVRAAAGYIPNFATTEVNKDGDIVLLIGTRQQGDKPVSPIYAHNTKEGMRYLAKPDQKYRNARDKYVINVPTYSIAPNEKGKPPFDTSTASDELAGMVGEEAVTNFNKLPGSGGLKGRDKFLRSAVKPSDMNATAGLMFEAIIKSFLKGPVFDKAIGLAPNTRLDLPVDESLRGLFTIPTEQGGVGAEAKFSGKLGHVESAADKIFDVLIGEQAAFGKSLDDQKIGSKGAQLLGLKGGHNTRFGNLDDTQRRRLLSEGASRGRGDAANLVFTQAAGGYIPNFSALDDAVSRERSAGLPVSQIRINQSGRLRNSQNPMGLAVTNTRDEPRGTIPNFQRRSGADGLEEGVKDATGKLIGLSIASSILSTTFGTVSEEATGVVKYLAGLGEGLTKVISTLTLFQAVGANLSFSPSALAEQSQSFAEKGAAFGQKARDLGKRLQGQEFIGSGFARVDRGPTGGKAGRASKLLGKSIGGVGKLMGGLGKNLGRLIPFIGPLIIGFQAINAIFPKFGESLKNLGTGILQTLGFIDTPAEKAAKALNKLADSAIRAAIESKDFSNKSAQALIDALATASAEQRAKDKLKTEQDLSNKEIKEIEEGGLRARLVNERFRGSAFTSENVGLRAILQQSQVTEATSVGRAGVQRRVTGSRQRGLSGTEQARLLQSFIEANEEGEDLSNIFSGIKGQKGPLKRGKFIGLTLPGGEKVDSLSAFQNETIERLTQAATLGAATPGQREKLFDPDISDSDFKEVTDNILKNLPKEFQSLLDEGILNVLTGKDAAEVFKALTEATKETKEEVKELTKEEKSIVAVAKSRLALELKFRDAKRTAFDVVSDQLKIESQLTSTSRVRRSALENEIKLLQTQDKILGEAANKVTTDLSAGLFSDDAQKESKGKLNEITALVDQVNLAMRSGEKISEGQLNIFEEQAAKLGLGVADAKKFRDELLNQNNVSLKLLALEDAKIKKAALLKSIIEAQNTAYERNLDALQRSLTLTSDLAAVESRLQEARTDSRIAQLEAQKIGVGNASQRGVDAQIIGERRNQAIYQAGVADEAIVEQLRSSIFQAVRQARPEFATPELRDRLRGADTTEDYNNLIRELNQRDKEARIAEIKRNFEEAQKASEILNGRINATNLFASSATVFASAVNDFALAAVETQIRGVHSSLPEWARLSERRKELNAKGVAGLQTLAPVATVESPDPFEAAHAMRAVAGSADFLAESLQDVKKAELERAIVTEQLKGDLIKFDNTLKEAGASAKTFGNLLRDLFLNLDEAIASNIFNIRTGNDINSIISQGTDLRRNQRLLRGPAAVGTVNEADRDARREQHRLRMGAAGTYAEKANLEKEFAITEELFAIRDKMNKEGKSAEEITLALVEKKLELERKRTSLSEALRNKFLKTEDEMFTAFNEGSADAVLAFSDGLKNGIKNAIQGTGDLKDALLGAVTAFNNKLLDTALNSIFSGISNSIGSAFGAPGFNKGGMINGGSGRRDDVPALLTGGEYVINRESVQKYGRGFFEMLNAGSVMGFQQGGYFAPGLFGQGPISGKGDLLDFATQAFTTGDRDVLFGGGNTAAIGLEPESVRLTNFGRTRGTPSQQATQDAKAQAFDLFVQQNELEERIREEERQRKRALRNQLLIMGVSLLGASMLQGGIAANRAAVSAGGRASVGTFLGGTLTGGIGADNQRYGGLLNTFSSGFRGFRSGPPTPTGTTTHMAPLQRRATGGQIPPAAGMDTVGAMLNGSEFVMNTQATNTVGAGNLAALNAGASSFVTEDTAEDLNQRLIDKLDEVVESSASGVGDINITVNSNGQQDTQTNGQGEGTNQNLARQIRDAVVNVIEQEKRLGGSLRRGLG